MIPDKIYKVRRRTLFGDHARQLTSALLRQNVDTLRLRNFDKQKSSRTFPNPSFLEQLLIISETKLYNLVQSCCRAGSESGVKTDPIGGQFRGVKMTGASLPRLSISRWELSPPCGGALRSHPVLSFRLDTSMAEAKVTLKFEEKRAFLLYPTSLIPTLKIST